MVVEVTEGYILSRVHLGENFEHASGSGRGSEWVVICVVFVYYMNNISSVYNFASPLLSLRTPFLASSPGPSQILSRSREEKSGCEIKSGRGLGTRLLHFVISSNKYFSWYGDANFLNLKYANPFFCSSEFGLVETSMISGKESLIFRPLRFFMGMRQPLNSILEKKSKTYIVTVLSYYYQNCLLTGVQ